MVVVAWVTLNLTVVDKFFLGGHFVQVVVIVEEEVNALWEIDQRASLSDVIIRIGE